MENSRNELSDIVLEKGDHKRVKSQTNSYLSGIFNSCFSYLLGM